MASLLNKNVRTFDGGYFDCRGAFQTVFDSYCCNGFNIVDNEA